MGSMCISQASVNMIVACGEFMIRLTMVHREVHETCITSSVFRERVKTVKVPALKAWTSRIYGIFRYNGV